MIRVFLALYVLASSAIALVALFRAPPLAVIIAFPLAAGLACLLAGAAILYGALRVPTDREAGLLIAGSLGLLAALNLGAASLAISRRR